MTRPIRVTNLMVMATNLRRATQQLREAMLRAETELAAIDKRLGELIPKHNMRVIK